MRCEQTEGSVCISSVWQQSEVYHASEPIMTPHLQKTLIIIPQKQLLTGQACNLSTGTHTHPQTDPALLNPLAGHNYLQAFLFPLCPAHITAHNRVSAIPGCETRTLAVGNTFRAI